LHITSKNLHTVKLGSSSRALIGKL